MDRGSWHCTGGRGQDQSQETETVTTADTEDELKADPEITEEITDLTKQLQDAEKEIQTITQENNNLNNQLKQTQEEIERCGSTGISGNLLTSSILDNRHLADERNHIAEELHQAAM